MHQKHFFIKNLNVYECNILDEILYYLYSITVWSAAPQTTLWGGPEPRFEPGLGGPEAGTLPLDHHTSSKYYVVKNILFFNILPPGIENRTLKWVALVSF